MELMTAIRTNIQAVAGMHQARDGQHDDDDHLDNSEPHNEGGRDFDAAVNEQRNEQRANHVHHVPGKMNVRFNAQSRLHQKAQVGQVYGRRQRIVDEEHPPRQKAGPGIKGAADVGVVAAGRR
jgi:hypothetical protein